jgi:hypothetical protein
MVAIALLMLALFLSALLLAYAITRTFITPTSYSEEERAAAADQPTRS